ncbi:histidine kinase [Streptococcus iniae]|uniref:histidine kinase n=1 Tax=Streptococcus iniae TaxID=1346 RepID=UPI000EF79B46|nr:histidine kinase [Streptococcus iniae]RLU63482.1 histidine kinase [Streptococcus iniae]RLU64660.1 histidine kinase [Streptococcus iniae]RLU66072.1 histidine kinase [Streptococcus iniae]RLU92573.1 histidine kinase [Streptococcus iniae]RLU96514.1 histidine kinase [Streptococcus iniae]
METLVLVSIFLLRFSDNLVIYFIDRHIKIPWGKVFLFLVFQMFIVGFVNHYIVWIEPIFFFLYHYFTHRNDKWTHHVFFSQFPIIMTDLLSKLILFFIIPLFKHGSFSKVVANDVNILLAYAFVLPTFLFLVKIFSIRNFSFVRYQTKWTNRFLVMTELSFIGYYLFILSKMSFSVTTEWYHKGIVLVFLLVLLYLISYMNDVTKKNIKKMMQEEERKHILLLEHYNVYLEKLYQKIRSFRYDYDNILLTLSASIETGNLETVKIVYHEIMLKLNSVVDSTVSLRVEQLSKIRNKNARILLAMKHLEAQGKGINLNYRICQSLGTPSLSEMDLMTVVAVTGDLAILISERFKEPEIDFTCYVNEQDRLVIRIDNQVKNLRKAFTREMREQLDITDMTLSILAERNPKFSYKIVLRDHQLSQIMKFTAEEGRFLEVK